MSLSPWQRRFFRSIGSASSGSSTRTVALWVGLCALALAVAVTFLPRLVPTALFRPLGTALLVHRGWLFTLVLAAGAVGVWRTVRTSRSSTGEWSGERIRLPYYPPEYARYDARRSVGGSVDRALADADEADPDQASWRRHRRRRDAYQSLRNAAATVLVTRDGCDRSEALRRLDDGTWTDDPRAAWFLGSSDVSEPPLSIRIRDWANGERYQRSVQATTAAIEAYETEAERR